MARITPDEYRRAFDIVEGSPSSKSERALALALDIRKFEIELYWKRATYFWAFLAVILAAYFALLAAKDIPCDQKGEALLIVSCLGVIFSTGWYFVNRASKFWQENWESHVDLLEDPTNGPLYKTLLSNVELSFLSLNGPYNFSVSKINQLLSLFVFALFLLLAGRTVTRYHQIGCPLLRFGNLIVFLTIAAVLALCGCGRTASAEKEKKVHAEKRQTKLT
jgi:hypothetical protein